MRRYVYLLAITTASIAFFFPFTGKQNIKFDPENMGDIDLQAVHDEMISVAYAAGSIILAANPADLEMGSKLNCK